MTNSSVVYITSTLPYLTTESHPSFVKALVNYLDCVLQQPPQASKFKLVCPCTTRAGHKNGCYRQVPRHFLCHWALASSMPLVSPMKDSMVSVAIRPLPSLPAESPTSIHIYFPTNHTLPNAMTVQDAFPTRSNLPFGHAASILESHWSFLCRCHCSCIHGSGSPCTISWSHRPLQRDCRSCISCPNLQREL